MPVIPVRRWSGAIGALALAAAAIVVPAGPAQAAVGCEVDYTATSWGTSFSANARIKNLGDTWNGYTIQFTFTGDQRVTTIWNHTVSTTGPEVLAKSSSWAPPVPTGDTLSFGFIGSYTGVNTPPTNWRVNGVACVLTGGTPTVIAEPAETSIPEGTGASFRVRLSHPPAQADYLGMTMRGSGRWSSQPVMLHFNATNWNNWQGFGLGSLQDPDTVDDVLVITLSFPGYLSTTVTFTQVDDD